jgi:predicted nucleic acid-binding protein
LKALVREGPVAVDTCVFIYFIESDPEWLPVVRPLFASAGAGDGSLVTSFLTLHEVLIVPYRSGNLALAGIYEALLTRSRGLAMIEMDRPMLRAAAELRARHRLKMADSFQIAAALASRCTSFVTNDRKIPDIPGLRIVQLSELG